jgi:2-succinyl-5-enolpyruvyl-6-hydroxy-3-cyclohexene-1-carboxylate synthase
MYSNYTRAYFEAAIPDETEEMVTYARNLIRRAVSAALKPPAGPVQINIPFREPLIPDLDDPNLFTYGRSTKPIQIDPGRFTLTEAIYNKLAEELSNVNKGIIVCGAQSDDAFPEAVIQLAERLQFPILADPLSQLRLIGRKSDWIIEGYDAFLKSEKALNSLKPDVIIRIGAMPVSKPFLLALKKNWNDVRHLVVDGGGEWRDPAGVALDMLYCDETIFCNEISKRISLCSTDAHWSKQWKKVNERTISTLATIRDQVAPSEGRAVYELNDLLPEGSQLFIANSMPIRDVDTFIHHGAKQVDLLCNRGANGIDGTISTALGASLNGKPTLLVTGDLSFFHDLNGLAATRLNELSLTIVIINNDGGGIFSFLPQADSESSKIHFDRLFLTSLNLPFEYAAKLYGAKYTKVDQWDQYRSEVVSGLNSRGIHIIEVQTDRDANVAEHRALWKSVALEIEPILEEK